METYNYRQNTNYVNEIEVKLEILSEKQARQVSEFIDEIEEKTKQKHHSHSLNLFDSAILPVLQDFAEITSSILTVEKDDKAIITTTLTNNYGFDITESCRSMRALINLSNHIAINGNDRETTLTLIFDFSALI